MVIFHLLMDPVFFYYTVFFVQLADTRDSLMGFRRSVLPLISR